jgi:anti-anti-sigma regulatory factor
MSCRIDRILTGQDGVVLRISGRIAAHDVDMLRALLEQESGPVALDLTHVLLVDRDAVKLLAAAEANGVALKNVRAYIREWIARERTQSKPGPPEPTS